MDIQHLLVSVFVSVPDVQQHTELIKHEWFWGPRIRKQVFNLFGFCQARKDKEWSKGTDQRCALAATGWVNSKRIVTTLVMFFTNYVIYMISFRFSLTAQQMQTRFDILQHLGRSWSGCMYCWICTGFRYNNRAWRGNCWPVCGSILVIVIMCAWMGIPLNSMSWAGEKPSLQNKQPRMQRRPESGFV